MRPDDLGVLTEPASCSATPRSSVSHRSTFASKSWSLKGRSEKCILVKQSEKHDGPHAPWFFDTMRSGGGVTFDMGCHAIEFFRWMLGGASAAR